MSGHSKWATTKHKKAAIDNKRAKLFTKLQKEIMVAAKLGDPNPDFNPRLRNAVIAAKSNSMPKDRIESAIKKASSLGEGTNYEDFHYEAYAPAGVALILDILTDNRNRAASDVRSTLSKNGGNLGESGSVAFMFELVGYIIYDKEKADDEAIFELGVELGATSVESYDDCHEVVTSKEDFAKIRDALIDKLGDPSEAKITWKPKTTVKISDVEQAKKVLRLIDLLEDCDDVQEVCSNLEIDPEIQDQLDE